MQHLVHIADLIFISAIRHVDVFARIRPSQRLDSVPQAHHRKSERLRRDPALQPMRGNHPVHPRAPRCKAVLSLLGSVEFRDQRIALGA